MTITDKQIDILESLIVEGIIALTTLPEGKKQYIDRVKKILRVFCKENNESAPDWIELSIPPMHLGSEFSNQSKNDYYSDLLPQLLNILRELQSQYYNRMQLDEIRKQTAESSNQTIEAQKQTLESHKANKWTKCALVISTFAVVVSIVAVCMSTCTRSIKIDETQYQEIIQHCLADSAIVTDA